jgi:plastocyanin
MMNRWICGTTIAVAMAMTTVAVLGQMTQSVTAPSRLAATTAPATAPLNESQVEIDNFTFKPKELRVSVGAKVTWVNKDDVPHTATSTEDPSIFDSKTLDTDAKYSFTFSKPGTYKYFCKVHPHMTGVVIVK